MKPRDPSSHLRAAGALRVRVVRNRKRDLKTRKLKHRNKAP